MPHHRRKVPGTKSQKVPGTFDGGLASISRVKVVTWNIELGMNLDVAVGEMQRHADLQDADVVLAQELSPTQADDLAELLGLQVVYGSAAIHCDTHEPFGNAIMSRYPMDEPVHLSLPYKALINGLFRSALVTTVHSDEGPVVVGTIHAETVLLDLHRRRQQVRVLAERLAATKGPCIVGGDFNTASSRSQRAVVREMSVAGMKRLVPTNQPTFRRFGRPFRLDHIFGRDVQLIDGGAVEGTPVSDHDPVWAEVRL